MGSDRYPLPVLNPVTESMYWMAHRNGSRQRPKILSRIAPTVGAENPYVSFPPPLSAGHKTSGDSNSGTALHHALPGREKEEMILTVIYLTAILSH